MRSGCSELESHACHEAPGQFGESSASTDHKNRPQQQSYLVLTGQLADPGNNRTLNKDASRSLQKM